MEASGAIANREAGYTEVPHAGWETTLQPPQSYVLRSVWAAGSTAAGRPWSIARQQYTRTEKHCTCEVLATPYRYFSSVWIASTSGKTTRELGVRMAYPIYQSRARDAVKRLVIRIIVHNSRTRFRYPLRSRIRVHRLRTAARVHVVAPVAVSREGVHDGGRPRHKLQRRGNAQCSADSVEICM